MSKICRFDCASVPYGIATGRDQSHWRGTQEALLILRCSALLNALSWPREEKNFVTEATEEAV